MPASKCFKKSRRERQDIVADKKKSHLSKRFRCEMTKMKIKKKKYEIKRRRRRRAEKWETENLKKKKLFLQKKNYTTTNDTVGRTRSNCFAMTPEIRNQSRCYPRLGSLTKALGILNRLLLEKSKIRKNLLFLVQVKKGRKKRLENGHKSGRRERIPLAPVFGYGSADGNNTRNSKLGSLFVSS